MSTASQPASPRTLQRARAAGNVARSGTLAAALVLACACATLPTIVPRTAATLQSTAANCFAPSTAVTPFTALSQSLSAASLTLWPFILALFLAAIAAVVIQVGPLFTVAPLAPDSSRLSASTLLARLQCALSPAPLAVATCALLAISAAAGLTIWTSIPIAGAVGRQGLSSIAPLIVSLASRTLAIIAGAGLIIGVGDLAFGVWNRRESLKLTPEQARREQREEEGVGRSRRRDAGDILLPADAHLVVAAGDSAVALRFDPALDSAPRIVSAGIGWRALALSRAADEARIPVIADAHIAALARRITLGEFVPEHTFDAAARTLREAERQNTLAGRASPWRPAPDARPAQPE